MISGLVAQILLFLVAAAIVGFLAGWFLGRQREAELLAELSKQRGLEERLAGRITQAVDGLSRPAGTQTGETTAVTVELAAVRDEVVGLKALLEGLRVGQADFGAKLSSLASGLVTIQAMRMAVDFRPLEHRLEGLGADVQRSLTPDFAWVKEDIGGVKRDVVELCSEVEALKVGQLAGLQSQVQSLRGVVEPIAGRLPTGGELVELKARLEELSRDVVHVKTEVEGAGQRLAELSAKAPGDEARVIESLGGLEAAMEALGAKVEGVGSVVPELRERIGALHGEVAAVGRALDALKDEQGGLGGRLMGELEGASSAAASLAEKVEGLVGGVESLRGVVERPNVDFSPLDAKLGQLAGGVESLLAAVDRAVAELAVVPSRMEGPLSSVVARMEALREAVEGLRSAAPRPAPTVDLSPLEAMVRGLVTSVASLRHGTEPIVPSPLQAESSEFEAHLHRSLPLSPPDADRAEPPMPAARSSMRKSASSGPTAKKARPRR